MVAAMALDWLKLKLEGGFSEYDSNAYLAIDTLALVASIEYSPNQENQAICGSSP
jgi:hypothetical protein